MHIPAYKRACVMFMYSHIYRETFKRRTTKVFCDKHRKREHRYKGCNKEKGKKKKKEAQNYESTFATA